MIGKEKLHAILRQPNPALDQKPKVSSAKTKPAPMTFEPPLWYLPRGSRNAMSPAVPTIQPLALRSWPFAEGTLFRMKKLGRTKLSIVYWARTVGLLSLCAAGTAIAENYSLAAHVRTANDRFKDVAVAVSEGYAPIPCASGADGGAMGVHYVKASLIGESVDIKQPQAIMYEPKVD